MKKLYALAVAILCLTYGYAATVTTAPNVRICTNTYTSIGNIVITEAAVGEFVVGTNYYLFLVAPTGFEFNPAAAVAINVGAPNNVANQSILFKTSSVIAVKYDITAITQIDVFTISNITMRALSVSGTTGNVTVGTGSYSLGAGTTLATVSSALTALSFTAPAATCSNSATISLVGTAADAVGTGVGASSAFSGPGVTGTNFNPATAGAGTHTLTYTVNTTTPTCVFSITSNMVVNAAPIVSISSSENSGNSPNDNDVCTADNITFTAFGATTYQFRIDGVNSSTTNPWVWTPGAGNVGARNITVIGTTGGCSTTSAALATDVFLKPNVPTFNPSVTTFDISTPGFKLDTLSPAATPAITANSYFSQSSGTGIGNTNNNYFYPSIAGNGSYVVTYNYVDANGCSNNSVGRTITVTSAPAPGVISGLATSYCVYDPAVTISVLQASSLFTNYQFEYYNQTTAIWVPMATTTTGVSGSYTYSATFDPAVLSLPANGGPGAKQVRYQYLFDLGFFSFTLTSGVDVASINLRPTVDILNSWVGYSCQSDPIEPLLPSPASGGTSVFSSPTTGSAGLITFSGTYNLDRSGPFIPSGGKTFVVRHQFTDATTGCVNTIDKNVSIDRTPSVPVVVAPPVYCQGDFVSNLEMTTTTTGTLRWYRLGSPIVRGSTFIPSTAGGSSFYTPGVLAITDTFYATMTNSFNTCTSAPSANLRVIMNVPATVDAGVYSNVCSSNPTVTLAGSRTPGGLGITWSSSIAPTNGGFTNLTITNPDYTAKAAEVSAGVMTLFLTTADPDGIGSGCPAVTDVTQIFINNAPTINAGPDAVFCSNALVTLLGSYGTTTTASTWYKNAVGGSQIGISTPLSIFSTYTPTLAERNGGPITFVIESNDPDGAGPCTAVNDQVTITINPEAVVSAGVTTVSCGSGGVSLVGTCTLFGGSALGATWTGGAGGVGAFAPNNTTLTATYTPTLAESLGGSIFFTLTSADPDGAGPCTALASSVFKTINLAPTINAGPDATFCSSTDPILTATLGGSTSALTWSRLGVGGTINTPLNTTTTYTIPVGEKSGTTITFVATSNDPDGAGPCVSVSDQVAITVNPEVLVDAGTSIVTCGSANVALSGTCVTFGGGNLAATWSKGIWNSGLIAAGTNPKNATYTPTAGEATSGGAYVYFLTSADPDGVGPTGPCPALSDFVINTINPAPFVNAGVDATWCSNTTPSVSAVLSGSATSLTWTKSSGSGTILSPTSPITDYIVSPGDYALGTPLSIDFTATTNDPDGAGPCAVATDLVTITLNPHLTVDAGTDIVVCAGQPINTSGNVKIGGIDRLTALVNNWSVVVGAGSTTQNGPSNFTGNYLPTGNMLTNTGELGLGASMILQLTSNDPDGPGPCTVASDLVRVTINQRARVSAGADTVFCANDVMNLNGSMLTASTDFVTWTGRPLSSFNSAYIVNPIYTPIAPAELYGNTYNAATGTILPNQITFTITGNDPDGTGPCSAESDDVLVSINPKVTVNAGTDMAFCGHTLQQAIPAMAALVNTANIKLGNTDRLTTAPAVNAWTIVSGSGTPSGINFASNFNINYTPSGSLADSGLVANNGSLELGNLSTITLQLSTTDPDGAGPCLAASDQVNLTIYPRPIPHFVGFETEYCRNTDDVRYLEGNISSTISDDAVFSIVGGVNNSISTSGNNYVFSPSDVSINNNGATFDVRYRQSIKEDLTNTCYNYVDTTVRVFPIPYVNFTASSRCQNDTITFSETASINSSVFPGTEIDWDWYIDNDTLDNSVTPNISSLNRASTLYSFLNFGNHTIRLITTTNSGGTLNCINQIDTTLIFGPYPVTNYSWLNPCSVDSVAFTNGTSIAPGYSNSITWNFNGAGTLKNSSTVTTANPYYQYTSPGIYNAQLIATTNIYNCTRIKTKEVFVVPTYSITGSDPYDSSFTTNLNWAPSSAFADSSYSWTHGTPVGKQVINPGKNVWITNLTGGYRIGERSYLNSPCFNMQTLDKPMMVMKAWSNSRNLAGTVLEASVGNTNTWTTIGQIGDGLNWYDTQGIVGLIGASSSNPIAQGFSGEDANWELSRIGLSQFSNQPNLVRFRLVFGSSNVNDPLNVRDGVALDSIWIGNRSKVVLAEHFTNSLCPSCIEANDTINSIQSVRPVDMVSVHYHTSFPGADLMNASNPSDPSSKVLFYGVSNTPRSFIDGTQMFSEYGNTPTALSRSSIDTKALENAKFKLDLSTTKSGMNLNVKTQIIATEPLSQDIVLNVAVLEDYVSGVLAGGNQPSGYRWVLKKMLPDAAGSYISKNWAVNDTVKTNHDWEFTLSSFYDTSKIVVVAFVQNYSTKEVYQAVKISSNGNTNTPIITSFEPQDMADNLLIYPVPADNEVNVLFANDITKDTEYSLTNDIGKVVEKGIIEQGVRMLSFNTKKYAAGLYYLSIPKPDGGKIIRKIVVIH